MFFLGGPPGVGRERVPGPIQAKEQADNLRRYRLYTFKAGVPSTHERTLLS